MKIYQIITVSIFLRAAYSDAGSLEVKIASTSPVISTTYHASYQEAKDYVEIQRSHLHAKVVIEQEYDDQQEYIRVQLSYNNGTVIYKLNVIDLDKDTNINYLDEFCRNEAEFRLTELLGVSKKLISDKLLNDAAQSIRDTIDNGEELADVIDNNLREVINQYKREQTEGLIW